MRVVVMIESGENEGRKVVIRPGQRVHFGRTSHSEAAFPRDSQMSRRHFRVSTDQKACYLQDLGSRNGTYVNQEPVSSVVLRTGDLIAAGTTLFRVKITGDNPDAAHALPDADAEGTVLAKPSPTRDTIEKLAGNFSRKELPSGLVVCKGGCDDVPPDVVTLLLSMSAGLTFVVDYPRIGMETAEQIDEPRLCFDWLPEEAALATSPICVGGDEVGDWGELLEEAWGQDALVTIISKESPDALFDTWKGLARTKLTPEQESDGIVGVFWPSVLTHLLKSPIPSFVNKVMNGVFAIVIEDPKDETVWQVFGPDAVAERLSLLGMVEVDEVDMAES